MKTAQVIIKGLALVLAGAIIISIIGAVIGGVYLVGVMTGNEMNGWPQGGGDWTVEEIVDERIAELDINVKASNVKLRLVEDGELVRVETNNEYVSTWTTGKRLDVVEKSHGFFGMGGDGDVIVYIRRGAKFDRVKIEIGAGTLDVEELATKELDLDLGAGKVLIDNLEVSEQAKIDGGAGTTTIRRGEMHNAKLDLGVGKTELKVRLTGESKIDAGVGKLELTLIGNEDDYRITVDKGIGTVDLNGNRLGDGARWGNGENRVDLESGVGAVEIRMEEDSNGRN